MNVQTEGDTLPHYSVLYQETIQALRPRSGGLYVDGTLGAGGHAWGILEASSPDGKLLGLDVDPAALEIAGGRLAPFIQRTLIQQASYRSLGEQLANCGWQSVDGILLDLGLSSMQLDTPGRGFSFRSDAPLDMRFDRRSQVTAAQLVNQLSERELQEVLYKYGEEHHARRITRAIVAARPIHTTRQLADAVLSAVPEGERRTPSRTRRLHPATRTFQALRIAVNQELDAIESVLPQAVAVLVPGGRLVVISYHSLEDRLVKQFSRRESRDCICPPRQPVCTCGHTAQIIEVTRKPIRPQTDEVERNPRSRSARMRVLEKK